MSGPGRALRHLFGNAHRTRRLFNATVLGQIEQARRAAEAAHAGEIRFVVETALPLGWLWHRRSARERALHLFSHLRLWDTPANNGVLIYVLRADRAIEIVADRGISERVAPEEWQAICREAQSHYRTGHFADGSRAAVEGVSRVLMRHFPATESARESGEALPIQPVLL